MKKYLFVLFLSGLFVVNNAQERIIHGKVNTLENIPVCKAKVKAMSSKQEVLTDSTGMFSIGCNDKDKLKIYAHGFYVEKVKVSKDNKFILANIRLKPGIENREYAIGYGHVADDKRLSAISSLNNEDLNFSRYNSMIDLIQGQFPGVRFEGGQVIIRNTTTMVGNIGALLILDGRSVEMSDLNELVPGDVKSINIIKDAGAAMYGVKGANGVVVIETRRGGD